MVMNGSLKDEFERLNNKTDSLSRSNSDLVSQLIKLTEKVSKVTKQNKELKNIIISKDSRIAELEQQINKNSRNSSKPPGSDFFNKPKPSSINKGKRAGGKKKKKASGGQKGHKGSTMKLKETPDVIHQCLPADCITCKFADSCESSVSVAESRNVVDVRIISKQSQYDRIQRLCPKSNTLITGSFPEGVNAPLQYGSHLKAMVVALSSFGMVSAGRICELMGGLAGISLSDGTVCNILADCANRCSAYVPGMKEHILDSYTAHFDETGIRVNGKIQWAHTSSTDNVTYITAHAKRGVEGILAGGVLQHFNGIAVHDCWGSYYHEEFKDATHSACGAHIDRELEGVIQNCRQRWAMGMKNLLWELYDTKRKLLAKGVQAASKEMVKTFFAQYDRILERGFSRNPYREPKKKKRGRPKKGKVLSLLERLRDLKDDVLRFFTDFRVPFSNNIGEKSFRLSKLKMKVAGSFRSAEGGSNFCLIFSVIDTVRKNGGNPFKSLVALFNNSFSLSFLN